MLIMVIHLSHSCNTLLALFILPTVLLMIVIILIRKSMTTMRIAMMRTKLVIITVIIMRLILGGALNPKPYNLNPKGLPRGGFLCLGI